MSLFYDSDEYEISTEVEINTLLAELPFDLIKESIIEQINDPMSTDTDYIEVIIDKCDVFKKMYENDPDIIREIDLNLHDFITFVIQRINDRFDLGLDIEGILLDGDLVETSSALYEYFIVRYKKNIIKFFTNFIMDHRKILYDEFNDTNKKDVSTLAYKKQIKSKEDLVIITNLNSIINYIIDLNVDPIVFISYSASMDNYEAGIITNMISNNRLVGNFISDYFNACIDEHDYLFDDIQTDIKTRILKKI